MAERNHFTENIAKVALPLFASLSLGTFGLVESFHLLDSYKITSLDKIIFTEISPDTKYVVITGEDSEKPGLYHVQIKDSAGRQFFEFTIPSDNTGIGRPKWQENSDGFSFNIIGISSNTTSAVIEELEIANLRGMNDDGIMQGESQDIVNYSVKWNPDGLTGQVITDTGDRLVITK